MFLPQPASFMSTKTQKSQSKTPIAKLPKPVDERVIRRRWNRPQSQFLKIRAVPGGPTQYIDLEGAVGSGKTTAPAWKLCAYLTEWPGIHTALASWTDDMLGPPKAAF